MKKSNKKILIPVLAGVAVVIIAICVVFAVTAKNNTNDKTATEPTATTATEVATEAQTEEATQAETQAETQATTDKPADNNSANELVIPTVTGIWKHEQNLEGCTIEVKNQNGNTIDITITSVRGEASQIATCNATVALEAVDFDTEVRGEGTFDYTDSFGNKGTCTISVAENVILLVVNEDYNDGKGWGISNATGDYILFSE